MRSIELGGELAPTRRQYEVLASYVRWGSHAAAAAKLAISPKTVESHMAALRARLGVHNEAQAVHVLWLGYAKHVRSCPRRHHAACSELEAGLGFFELSRTARGSTSKAGAESQ
jgi:DNA-binding CsgD family transcriptional regulator